MECLHLLATQINTILFFTMLPVDWCAARMQCALLHAMTARLSAERRNPVTLQA